MEMKDVRGMRGMKRRMESMIWILEQSFIVLDIPDYTHAS